MENNNYEMTQEEEVAGLIRDIEKNSQDEKPSIESSFQEELPVDVIEEDAPDNLDEESNQNEKEESISEAELFREKYYLEKKKRKSILADRQKLEQENYQLKNVLDGTVNNNAELYGQNLYNDLEKIKNIKKQAMLGAFGDPNDPDYYAKNADILAEADDLYQKASYKINEFENIISNKNSSSNDEEDFIDRESYYEQVKLAKAQEWVSEHPELVESSYKYNPKIQRELGSFIEQFDYELKRNGRENEILSDAYLDVLDEFVDSVKINRSRDGYTTSNVGGVRNNFSNGTGNTIKVTLTDFDKNYAKSLGITERDYLKAKIDDIKELKMKNR